MSMPTLVRVLDMVPVPEPGPDEIVIRVEAAPLNPSDMGLLFGGADMAAAVASGPAGRPVVTAPVPDAAMRGLAGRVGTPMPAGNEGAGTVVAAGGSAAAQALLGKIAAAAGGGMYSQYRAVNVACAWSSPERRRSKARLFVNPLLGMVETMRMENHSALVHTAAASSLGQMLNRLCIEQQIPLVNIVRKPGQEAMLRAAGAVHVCNSASAGFMAELTGVLQATGATLAFDAIGGGRLASQILAGMEAAANAAAGGYSRYGSAVHKQVCIYGSLDRSPTELTRSYGTASEAYDDQVYAMAVRKISVGKARGSSPQLTFTTPATCSPGWRSAPAARRTPGWPPRRGTGSAGPPARHARRPWPAPIPKRPAGRSPRPRPGRCRKRPRSPVRPAVHPPRVSRPAGKPPADLEARVAVAGDH